LLGSGFQRRKFLILWVPELSPASSISFSLFATATQEVKVKVTLRLAVYRQSIRLGVKPLETHDQTFFNTHDQTFFN
jgi:hypothetical protein